MNCARGTDFAAHEPRPPIPLYAFYHLQAALSRYHGDFQANLTKYDSIFHMLICNITARCEILRLLYLTIYYSTFFALSQSICVYTHIFLRKLSYTGIAGGLAFQKARSDHLSERASFMSGSAVPRTPRHWLPRHSANQRRVPSEFSPRNRSPARFPDAVP